MAARSSDGRSIALVGPPDANLTDAALSYFKKPLLLTNLSECIIAANSDVKCDGIVFDNLPKMSYRNRLALYDRQHKRAIEYNGAIFYIPTGMNRIFTAFHKSSLFQTTDESGDDAEMQSLSLHLNIIDLHKSDTLKYVTCCMLVFIKYI